MKSFKKLLGAPLALACAFLLVGIAPATAQYYNEDDYYDFQDDEGFLGLGDEWPFGSESELEDTLENDYYYGYYDDDYYADDWYYDYYDYGYDNDYGSYDDSWYGADWWDTDLDYFGAYDDEYYEDDWFYDEYEEGHWDPWGWDDPGEEGLFDW